MNMERGLLGLALVIVIVILFMNKGQTKAGELIISEAREVDYQKVRSTKMQLEKSLEREELAKIDEKLLDEMSNDLTSRKGGDRRFGVIIESSKNDIVDGPTYSSKYTDAIAKELGKSEIISLAKREEVKKLWLDEEVNLELSYSTPQINGFNKYDSTGGEGVRVCIIDSSIDDDHPYLKVVYNEDDRGSPFYSKSHGTHCAGIINSNHYKFKGVAPEAELIFLNLKRRLSDNMAQIERCVDMDADIISMSWGGGWATLKECPEDPMAKLLDKVVNEEGLIAVTSAGNSGNKGGFTPACAPSVISVASVDYYGVPSPWSSIGTFVDIAAPGDQIEFTTLDNGIVSTLPGGFGGKQGTSMACPHVAGAFALLKSISDKPNSQIVDAVYQTATPVEGYEDGVLLNHTYFNCYNNLAQAENDKANWETLGAECEILNPNMSGFDCHGQLYELNCEGSKVSKVGHGVIDVYAACKKLEGEKCDNYIKIVDIMPPSDPGKIPYGTYPGLCPVTCYGEGWECGLHTVCSGRAINKIYCGDCPEGVECNKGKCYNNSGGPVGEPGIRLFSDSVVEQGGIVHVDYMSSLIGYPSASKISFAVEQIPYGWDVVDEDIGTGTFKEGVLKLQLPTEVTLKAPNSKGNYTFNGKYTAEGEDWTSFKPVVVEVR